MFFPELPELKQQSINSLGVAALNKVTLVFSERWWPEKNTDWFDITSTDSKKDWHPWPWWVIQESESGKVAIVGYIAGKFSKWTETLSENYHKSEVMKFLRNAFPDCKIPEPERFFATKWCKDEFSLGTYTYIPSGSSLETLEEIQCVLKFESHGLK